MANKYGVQKDGTFDRKFIDDIITTLETNIQENSGRDVDLRQDSPIKQALDTFAIEIAELWASQEENYYSAFYDEAFGSQLDDILKLAGVTRIPRRSATGEIVFQTEQPNNEDIQIQSGTEVRTEETDTVPPIPFKTTETVSLLSGETSVTAKIKGLEPWETDIDDKYLGTQTNVASNTIQTLSTPIAGIDTVTNLTETGDTAQDYISGRDKERDAEFKNRYKQILPGENNEALSSIQSSIFNAHEKISSVSMKENNTVTDNTSSGGLPPKSFSPTVLDDGTLGQEIADAILSSRPAGIQSYGSISQTATTDYGSEHVELFNRATRVNIYVHVDVIPDGTQPGDMIKRINNSIVEYIGGTDSGGAFFPGTVIGEDVIFDQVFASIMRIDGVLEAEPRIAKSSNPTGTSNLNIDVDQVANVDVTDISITVQ